MTYLSRLVSFDCLDVLQEYLEVFWGHFLQTIAVLKQPHLPSFVEFPIRSRTFLARLRRMSVVHDEVVQCFDPRFLV